jgi:hypothetical protein
MLESSVIGKQVSFDTESFRLFDASLTRSSEISRQIGFLRFYSLDDCRTFVERNFPTIYLYGRNSGSGDRAAKVRIAYSREREDRRTRAEGEWICRNVCYRSDREINYY